MAILNNQPFINTGLFDDINKTNNQISSMNIPQAPQAPQAPQVPQIDPMIKRQRYGNMMLALSDVLKGRDPSEGVLKRQQMIAQQQAQAKQQKLIEDYKLKDPEMAGRIDAIMAGIPESIVMPRIPKTPASYQEYVLTLAPGEKPSGDGYDAYMLRKQKAGGTVVQLGKEEEEYVKSLAKLGQTDITESRKIATTSRELIPRLQTAQILLQNPDFVTGPLTEKFLPLKKLYNDLTGQDQTEVSGQELFQALANYTVPRMRPPGSGATSDFEANLFSTATIGLGKSKESNELLVATMIQQAKREQKLLKEKEKYFLKNKGNTVGFEQYLEENNLVPPLYQQINLQSQDIGEFYDKGLIRNGEAYIDMTDPNFPKLTVFRIADFD